MEMGIFLLLLIIGGIAFYFIPTIIAFNKNHKSAGAICLVNLLFGWSFIGWIWALIWAFSNPSSGQTVINIQSSNPEKDTNEKLVNGINDRLSFTDQLSQIGILKENGHITKEEFDDLKAKILKSN